MIKIAMLTSMKYQIVKKIVRESNSVELLGVEKWCENNFGDDSF